VPYVHVVFTLLHRLLPLAYRNSTRLYTLRAYAERELGGGFDIRAFHDEILRNGPLPLNVLNAQIRDWVAARKRDHRGIGDRVVSKKSIGLYSAGPLRG